MVLNQIINALRGSRRIDIVLKFDITTSCAGRSYKMAKARKFNIEMTYLHVGGEELEKYASIDDVVDDDDDDDDDDDERTITRNKCNTSAISIF